MKSTRALPHIFRRQRRELSAFPFLVPLISYTVMDVIFPECTDTISLGLSFDS